YEAFLQQALDAELGGCQQRALERRLRAAHLPRRMRLDAFDFSFQPSLSERLVRELISLRFVETATNVVLLGRRGVGRTHQASALALAGMEAGLFGTVHPVESVGHGAGGTDRTRWSVRTIAALYSSTYADSGRGRIHAPERRAGASTV